MYFRIFTHYSEIVFIPFKSDRQMEETKFTPEDLTPVTHPQLTPDSIAHLVVAAKWGKFLAILGFITLAFVLLAGLLMGLVFSFMEDKLATMGGIGTFVNPKWIIIGYILIGFIGFIPVFFLNSFSNNVTRSVRNNDTNTMTTALKRLKSLFVFVGIYTIAMIAIYIIAIIVIAGSALIAA
jgi:hypothetical protein